MEVTTHSLAEFEKEARRFAAGLEPSLNGATIVCLSGVLGAGKTTFAQAVAKELGVTDVVNSPTFVIQKTYRLENRSFEQLIHMDVYRLDTIQQLDVLHWHEIVNDRTNLILLEWPEKVADAVPAGAIQITLMESGENRTITYGKK